MGQKPEKWVKNSQKSLNLAISDHFRHLRACIEGWEPPGKDKINFLYKITKIGSQGSISTNYIVLGAINLAISN